VGKRGLPKHSSSDRANTLEFVRALKVLPDGVVLLITNNDILLTQEYAKDHELSCGCEESACVERSQVCRRVCALGLYATCQCVGFVRNLSMCCRSRRYLVEDDVRER
jgi:hypothetical protein